MKTPAKIGIIVFAVLVVIQFVPVQRGNPPPASPLVLDPSVDEIIRRACYDCHSHETQWRWYGRIAPVSWLLAHDVKEGREHLNFSTWGTLPPEKQKRRIAEIGEEVREGAMPPSLYAFVHRGAKLTPPEKEKIEAWVRSQAKGQ